MTKRYYLEYIKIINNQRLYEGMGISDIEISMNNKFFIGIVGENGSGKSSLLLELKPTANYSYIRNKVGKKIMRYKSYDGVSEIHINFIFEPDEGSVNGHNCKIYIRTIDNITGKLEDMNVSGGFNSGINIIHKLLGYNDNVAPLFNISDSDMFFAERTANGRITLMQKIINGLDDLKYIAGKYLDKNRAISTSLKATNKKLEGMGDRVLLENNLVALESRISVLNEEIENIILNISNNDINQDMITTSENKIKILNKQVKDIVDTIIPFYITNYNADTEYIFTSDRLKTDMEIKITESQITNLTTEQLQLESELSTVRIKETLDINFDAEEMEAVEKFFEGYSEEDLSRVSTYNIESIHTIKTLIDDLDRLICEFNFAVYDYDEVISTSPDESVSKGYRLIDYGKDLKERKESLEKKLIGAEYINNLVSVADKNKTCNINCDVIDRLREYDSDIITTISALDLLEEEMMETKAEFRRNEVLSTLASKYKKVREYYRSQLHLFRKYIPKFDFDTVLRNSNTKDLKVQIAFVKTEYEMYVKLLKLSEEKKYVDIINSMNTESIKLKIKRIDDIKNIINTLTESLKLLKNKKNNMDTLFQSLSIDIKGYDVIYILSKNLNAIKMDVESRRKEITKLNEDLEKDKTKLRMVLEGEDLKRMKRMEIDSCRNSINDIRDRLGGIKLLTTDSEKLTCISQEMSILTNIVSKKLLSKVISSFMFSLKDIANNLLFNANLPYEILVPIVSDTEFKIPILKTQSALVAPDISNTSKGERTITNMALTISCQDVIKLPYSVTCLDEVDAFLSQKRKAEFMSIINRCVNNAEKQIFCISHDYKFNIVNQGLGLIILKDGEAVEGADILYDFRKI